MMWLAIILLFSCGVMQFTGNSTAGVIAGVIGIILIIYALATGKVKTFG